MGDSTDDSSNAAQSAQPEGQDSNEDNGGFFRRIIGALSPGDDSEAETGPGGAAPLVGMPGLRNLRDMAVEDVAIPKADIVSVPSSITRDELVEVFRDSGLTRLPVYDGTLDTPIGIANLKDFALRHGFNGASPDLDLREMVRPLIYVPPSMPLGVLLQKMQAERIHMALVIDEYGGTDGLVTIEDVIEQVVGEIEDEHDIEEAKSWVMEKPGCYLAQARTDLEDFEAEIGLKLTDHDQ